MRAAILLQYALPHRMLSRLVYHATRWTWRPWKNFLIRQITSRYRVDLHEAAETDIERYAHFNAFFTRLLKPGARPFSDDPADLLCPADGRISQLGPIRAGRIFQAKGQDFTVEELLGDDQAAAPYRDGQFVTVYLSPRDYHRVHMPMGGRLRATVHVPGRLFSVAPAAVAEVPRLFARNERLVCHFEGEHGPFVVVMVGALLVSSVSTVWGGLTIPPYARSLHSTMFADGQVELERGVELGRFNMGSTVILLFPAGTARLEGALTAESAVKVGQTLGRLESASGGNPDS